MPKTRADKNPARRRPRALAAALALLLGVLAIAPLAWSDDRDLLRENAADPYVFVVFATSGSMNRGLQQVPTGVADENGDEIIDLVERFETLRADSPGSKFFQAKRALFRVVDASSRVNFGFATFNQDEARVRSKHWLYRARGPAEGVEDTRPLLPGFGAFPPAGREDVFGRRWRCESLDAVNGDVFPDGRIGCDAANPADLDDAWEKRRTELLPKLGESFGSPTSFWLRTSEGTFEVEYAAQSGSIGSTAITVGVTLRDTAGTQVSAGSADFSMEGSFLSWDDLVPSRTVPQAFFNQYVQGSSNTADFQASDIELERKVPPDNTSSCEGWEPNHPPGGTRDDDDRFVSGNESVLLKYETGAGDPDLGPLTDVGDMIPLSWKRTNVQAIKHRLAPNIALGEAPDFGLESYFTDFNRIAGVLRLESDFRSTPPLLPNGRIPISKSIKDFRAWYTDWRDLAAVNDPLWGCRQVFMLVITDGEESCDSSVGGQANVVFQQLGVKIFVVGFGVEPDQAELLSTIAEEGGTDEPLFAGSEEELVTRLEEILIRVREESAAFASAAVPSVQTNVADKIYLSSFLPINENSIWQGNMDAFLKPLPLTEDNRPDTSRSCKPDSGEALTARCHLWDAADEILEQAPTDDQLGTSGPPDGNLGLGGNERRVVYPEKLGTTQVPRPRRFFVSEEECECTVVVCDGSDPACVPEDCSETPDCDLADALGLLPGQENEVSPGFVDSTSSRTVRGILGKKVGSITDPNDSTLEIEITYLLGDIFHSDPVVTGTPNRFRYFAEDLRGNGNPCDDTADPNRGYRCFFEKHRNRRRLLIAGANDGQLHVFDAGLFTASGSDPVSGLDLAEEFDSGTGRELFSFMPRRAMPTLVPVASPATTAHRFTVDGKAVVDDVFIDPVHTGIPSELEREWRTVLFAGLREGGAAYYALDLTQPDTLDTNDVPEPLGLPGNGSGTAPARSYVPSCFGAADSARPVGVDPNSTPSTADCGPVPFGAVLWELTDTSDEDLDTSPGKGFPDLGNTWSVPNTGRILVEVPGEGGADPTVEERFVAIFGGGMPPRDNSTTGDLLNRVGNWLYMVDIETGRILYKKVLVGSAPSEPAAVDLSQDGVIDTVYIGTAAGFLYKVDISQPGTLDAGGRIASGTWEPFKIFDTGGREIHFPPTVLFVADTNRFALAFGTGDRENLWRTTPSATADGRFYMLLDQGFTASDTGLPLTESDTRLTGLDVTSTATTANLLAAGGWFLRLDPQERMITRPFSLSGVTVFTSFQPDIVATESTADDGPELVCSSTGVSRIFVVFTTNGNSVMTLDSQPTRFMLAPTFVTNPFTEFSQTANVDSGDGKDADELTDSLRNTMETLKTLFPASCKFGNFTIDLKTTRSDTGIIFIAPIPVCIQETNWKEI